MMKHITSNITRWFYMLLAVPALTACLVCCSESSHIGPEIEPEKPDDNHDTDYPMSFAASDNDGAVTRATYTDLTTDFMVSTYKSYGSGNTLVMDKYKVNYKQDGWNNILKWDYTVVDGQYIKYWDYSNFPYRFHAIAPCPTDKTGFVLTATELKIPAGSDNIDYQTCVNGTPTNNADPKYYIAQVQRNKTAENTDKDIISGEDINRNNGNELNRIVTMVFHRLTSKIRFGIYSTSPWTTANKLYITDLKIKVASDKFLTNATGFECTSNTGSFRDNGSFLGTTKKDDHPVLLQYDGTVGTEKNDLSKFQGQSSAFFLECKDGLRQLPQKDVYLTVSFNLKNADGTTYKTYTDIPVKWDDVNPLLTWKAGYLYTYYLVINNIDEKLEISFTATLTPWENISGSLSTDLEK